ncbi:hypothetical protein Tco_0064894 [Tanacetum coccineum]
MGKLLGINDGINVMLFDVINASTGPSAEPQDDTSVNVVHDTLSPTDSTNDAENVADMEQTNNAKDTKILKVKEEQCGKVSNTLALDERTIELYKGHAGSDPEKPGKANVETEVESMVTVLIHQASSSGPPLFTPIIDLSPPKPVSPPLQEPVIAATTTTTTTLPPPPPPTQSITYPNLATRVSTLEKRRADFEHKYKLQDKTTKAFASGVYNLENHDLYYKINKYVNEVVKEVVYTALQAPLREHFRDLSKFQMKEILHDHMFESGSYRLHLDHTTLYKALKLSMQHEKNDEIHEVLATPPPKDSDQNKKKKHDSDSLEEESRRESYEELMDEAKVRRTYPEVQRTSKRVVVVEFADSLAKTYKDPKEYKLLWKTRDMASFIKWYCKQIGKKELVKDNFEGQAYKIVRPFHKNNISLQFQMEEYHLLLADQIDLINPEGNQVVHDISKPLPLGGPPGQVTIQPQYFFNKDLEYLVSSDKERRHALSISKLKEAYHPDFGLEELVPSLWIEIRFHMTILSVVSLNTYSRYGYTYMREIVLRRADYKEYKISEVDFKNLHPNDFKDVYLVHLQGKLNHLSGANKVHLFTIVNLWIRNIVIRQRVEDLQLGIGITDQGRQDKSSFSDPPHCSDDRSSPYLDALS